MKDVICLIFFSAIFSLETQFIKYDEEEKISILTINPPKVNTLNSQVLDELGKTLDIIDTNKIRAFILTGASEKSFVAGADIAEMSILLKNKANNFQKKEMMFLEN